MKQPLNTPIKESFELYLSKSEYISASNIKSFRISPMHYWLSINGDNAEETKTMKIGTAMHMRLIQGDLFDKNYACLKKSMLPVTNKFGEANYTLKENKYFRDVTFPGISQGKIILEEVDYDMIIKVCDKAKEHETIKAIFSDGTPEVSMYKLDPKTQLIKRGRCDWLPNFGDVIPYVKTCLDSSEEAFSKEIANRFYHNQAEWYLDLFGKKEFLFIALEKSDAAIPQIHLLNEEAIEIAKKENRMYLDLICWSYTHNFWADYNGLEVLKNLYLDKMLNEDGEVKLPNQRETCHEKDWDYTLKTLDKFFDIRKESRGVGKIGLPSWYVRKNQL